MFIEIIVNIIDSVLDFTYETDWVRLTIIKCMRPQIINEPLLSILSPMFNSKHIMMHVCIHTF